MTVEESVVVARPPGEVYDFVADLERAPEWQSSLESVDVERGVEVRTFAGHRREASFEVTQHERPIRFGVESRSGPVRAHAVFAFAPVDEATQVDFRLDVEVGGAARLAAGDGARPLGAGSPSEPCAAQ